MKSVQLVTWIVAPFVIAALTISFTLLMLKVFRRETLLVKTGMRDKEIIRQSRIKARQKLNRRIATWTEYLLLGIIAIIFLIGGISAIKNNEFSIFGKNVKVCVSNSMAGVHPMNKANASAGGQGVFAIDDILIIDSMPPEEDLKLYDVVTYKDPISGHTVIHRIVEITSVSGTKIYKMRGDANTVNDSFGLSYSELTGIYHGHKLSGAGIVVRFVQSPFGLITFLVCIYICILEELLSRRLYKADAARLAVIDAGYKDSYVRVGEDDFAVNEIAYSEIELEVYAMEERGGCKIPLAVTKDFGYQDVFDYLSSLPEVFVKLGQGKRPTSFSINSRAFALLYSDSENKVKMTFKTAPSYGTALSQIYSGIEKPSFPHGLLWFSINKNEDTVLELFKLLADISYRISKSNF